MVRLAVSLSMLAVLVGSCSSGPSPKIEGIWLYETFDGTAVVVGETAAQAPSFTFRDGTLSANAGCNEILSDYALDAETLRFEGGSITEAGCEDGQGNERVMSSERAYLAVTRAAPDGIEVTIAGDSMTWTTPGGELRFSLVRRF